MPSQQTMLQKLMNTDVSLFLMAGAVLVCVVGYFFGFMVALKTLGGVLIGLFAIGMPLLLMHGDELETEQLEAAQREFGGRLRRHLIPLQGSRSLTFEHQDTVGRFSIHRRSGNSVGSSWLELRLRWPDRRLKLNITPQNVLARTGQFFGMQDITIGREGFDDRYVIRGNDEEMIRQLLSRRVQRAIYAMPDQTIFGIRIQGGIWRARAGYRGQPVDFREFVAAGLKVYDAMRRDAKS